METFKTYAEGRVARPSRSAGAGTNTPDRSSVYGERGVVPYQKVRQALADEGSYFVATNPTPGTAIAGIAGTGAFADAESLLLIRNGASDADGTRVYLDFIELISAVAGTNGTNVRFVSKLDIGVDRYTSGGSAIVPVNPNSDSSAATVCTVKFGALVTTAASASARLVQNGLVRNVITVVGDRYLFDFGGDVQAPGHAIAGTAIADIVIPHVPVVLGPGDSFVFSIHAASQTVASEYEFNIGWYER